jgi:hypothetical protein
MLATALAFAFAIPTLSWISSAEAKSAKAADESSDSADKTLSKEDQAKLKEHNKLRAEIMKVKYPAAKDDVVSHVKGIKPDDKKWFEETLPDKTYKSADDVMAALGWEVAAPADKAVSSKPTKAMKGEKAPR